MKPVRRSRLKARGLGRLARIAPVLALAAGALFLALQPGTLPRELRGQARAADGDSLWLGDERVRLLGLDAPELDQTCRDRGDRTWLCGADARNVLASLVHRAETHCVAEGRDRYRRLLAACAVEGRDLGAALVRAGLAISDGGYAAEERAARDARIGVWGGTFQRPREWREQQSGGVPEGSLFDRFGEWLSQLTSGRLLP